MKDKELRKFLGVHNGGWWGSNLCGCYVVEPKGEIPYINNKIEGLSQKISDIEKRIEKLEKKKK